VKHHQQQTTTTTTTTTTVTHLEVRSDNLGLLDRGEVLHGMGT